ncbi:hypothetical protein RYX36_019278 [Vicia faba]
MQDELRQRQGRQGYSGGRVLSEKRKKGFHLEIHNNGYSFPNSTTSLGATAAIRGARPSQTTHLIGGSLYSSQTFHPFQDPQSHPHKQETEVSGNNVQSFANHASYPIKNSQGQNFTIPVQLVNFSFKPSATSDTVGGNSKQQQALNGGVEVIPSQALAVSFASFNGTSFPSNLNFSSMKQNPLVNQSLPDVSRQGYQAVSTPQTVQQKTYSITMEKRGGNSSHQDDEKKTTHIILQVLNSLRNCFRNNMACNNNNLQQLFKIKLHPPILVLLQNLLTMALFSHKVTIN